MSIKIRLLKSLIWTSDDILYISSHHVLAYFWIIVITFLLITIVFFSFNFFKVFSLTFASWFAWLSWILIYIYFILNFLDIYLDVLAVTNNSVIIYKWFWLFKSTTDVLEFDAIESVFYEQEWVINVLFDNWDIFLRRASHSNVFNDVHNPSKVVDNINRIIRSSEEKEEKEEENDNIHENDDFKLFVEAMAEIIKEYKKK